MHSIRYYLVLFVLTALFGAGCSNLVLRQSQEAYRNGDLPAAQKLIDQYVAKNKINKENDQKIVGINGIIAHLEKGTILRAMGDIQGSNQAFDLADYALDWMDEQPDVSLSKEGLAAVTNMNALTYRGCNYDRIMLSTYRALNCFELGDIDGARVQLYRAYERQREAVERNAKRIEKAEEAAANSKEGEDGDKKKSYDVERAKENEKYQEGYQKYYADLEKYSAYTEYVNPFSEFLQGLYFMTAGLDDSDTERARVSLKRAIGMVPDNPYLKQDVAMVEQVIQGEKIPPTTYVIFETGVAPKRGQIRIDIPLFVVTNRLSYVGANFPRLIMNQQYLSSLSIQANNQLYQTHVIADMDNIVAQEFKNELPIIVTKTLIASGTKAVIAYWTIQAARHSGNRWVELSALIGTAIYQASTNEADLRTWASLPKQFQYARFPTPQTRTIEIALPNVPPTTIALKSGTINVVLIKSISTSIPLRISQFVLDKKTWQTASSQSQD